MLLLLLPSSLWAVEPASALSDREIAERLTRLETRLDEGLTGLRAAMGQLREDMNGQFAWQFRLSLALLGAFAVLVAATISVAVWDRRTAIRPFEREVTSLTEDLTTNRQRLESLLDALRTLGQRNPEVASVLKQFNLL